MTTENKNQKQLFRNWLESKGLKSETLKDYILYYDKVSLEQLCHKDYLSTILIRYKNNTVIRAFLKNLFEYLDLNMKLPSITGRRKVRIPEVIDEEDLLKIAASATNERNKLMILLSFYCGLRRGELLKITPNDFNWRKCGGFPKMSEEELKGKYGKLKTIGKGDKEGIALVPGKLILEIAHYLNHANLSPTQKLFMINKTRWAQILNRTSMKAIGKKIHPHTLRHSFATYLHQKGFDMRFIKEAMRHTSIRSTEIYTHVTIEDLEGEYLKKRT